MRAHEHKSRELPKEALVIGSANGHLMGSTDLCYKHRDSINERSVGRKGDRTACTD